MQVFIIIFVDFFDGNCMEEHDTLKKGQVASPWGFDQG